MARGNFQADEETLKLKLNMKVELEPYDQAFLSFS